MILNYILIFFFIKNVFILIKLKKRRFTECNASWSSEFFNENNLKNSVTMLRQTFLAAPRLEGIQEEDDHSGTDSNSTQNLKKISSKNFFLAFFIRKYQHLKIIIMVTSRSYLFICWSPNCQWGKYLEHF